MDAEPTADELRALIASALRRGGLAASAIDDLVPIVLPTSLEAYESALVSGLCRDGAREVLESTAIAESRRVALHDV